MKTAYEFNSPRQAHLAAVNLYQHVMKPHTMFGLAGRLTFETIDPHSRHEMRKLFHGVVLKDFSQQVRLRDPDTGEIYRNTPAVWKAHLVDLFCPAQFDDDGRELEKSTERMSDDQFSQFLDECQAYGVCDCGVTFTEREPA